MESSSIFYSKITGRNFLLAVRVLFRHHSTLLAQDQHEAMIHGELSPEKKI